MRVRRVRVRPLREGTVRLHGAEAHHLARVLRVAPGDPVLAFDGEGREAAGVVATLDDGGVEVRLEAPREAGSEAPLDLILAVALLKGDKLAQVVRQGTELGAARFVPFVAPRSDVPRLSPAKLDRLRRVAAEAAKQSGRARVPEVDEPTPFASLEWTGPAWVADPCAEVGLARRTDDLLGVADGAAVRSGAGAGAGAAAATGSVTVAAGRPPPTLTVITGPEGGFSSADVEALTARGALPVGLGPRILRAETAPVAIAAAVLARVDA